ncbi:MAG: hypothetical protein ACREB6_01045 [Rhodospirillales bacterium]
MAPLALMLALALAACAAATVPMASPEDDARAKSFAVAPAKANIYVYRVDSRSIQLLVSMDGRLAGKTVPGTYLMWEVSPGPREIGSIGDFLPSVIVNAVAGRNHFVRQHAAIGLTVFGYVRLEEVDEETGRREIAGCKRAKSDF